MNLSRKTPQKRINEFQNPNLIIKRQHLYCSLCKTAIDHTRKSSIKQHLETKLHKDNEQRSKQQPPDDDDEDVITDTIEAFSSSNIPLNKLTNPKFRAYLEKYFKVNLNKNK